MRKRLNRLISMMMTVVMIVMAGMPVMADSIPLTTPGGEGPNGTFDVYVYNEGWNLVEKVGANMYLKEQAVQVPEIQNSDGQLRVRIVKSGGGLAHLDQVLLDGEKPIEMNPDEMQQLYKLYDAEYDVLEVDENGLEVTFLNPEKSTELRFTGRIEAEVISETPHAYPLENQYKPIEIATAFYTYEWDNSIDSPTLGEYENRLNGEPFFKEFSKTGSGHPAGYTYGWVSNDEDNLYVLMDFTSDNTMDGDKDYAAVHINTPEGVKSFKVSVNATDYGQTYFTYTDKVEYQHKVYEFVIPRAEIPMEELDDLELTFTAYGTSVPNGQYGPALAYSTNSGLYLLVYEDYDPEIVDQGTIMGQFLNTAGDAYGVPFAISNDRTLEPSQPDVIYNDISGEFLIAWEQKISEKFQVYASIVDEEGVTKHDDFAVEADITYYQRDVQIAYSPTTSEYFIGWLTYGPGISQTIRAVLMDSEKNTTSINMGLPGGYQSPDVTYNSTDNTFDLVVVEGGDSNYGVKLYTYAMDGTPVLENVVLVPIVYPSPAIGHNTAAGQNYLVWDDTSQSPNRLNGQYVPVSSGALELSADYSSLIKYTRVIEDPRTGHTFVAWHDTDSSVDKIYGSFVDQHGDATNWYDVVSAGAFVIDSTEVDEPTAAYDDANGTFLMAYVMTSGGAMVIETEILGIASPSEIAFDLSSSSVAEGDDVTVTINRTGDTSGTAYVDYATISGSAIETDYTAVSGTAIFAPGEDTKTITVTTASDELTEGSETFSFILSNVRGAGLSTVTHTVTITDSVPDYGTIEFSSLSQTVNEGDIATITVYRTSSGGAVTIDYATSSGTATTDDYTTKSGTLSFADGDTSETITIQTTTDDVEELTAEDFTVVLSNPQGGASLNDSKDTHTVTIAAESAELTYGTLEFASLSQTVNEGDTVTITVSRTGGSDGEVTVDYATATGTAGASDFTANSGTLTFADGDTSETITVQTSTDEVEELTAENFTVVLSNPLGGASLNSSKDTHTVTLAAESAEPVEPSYGTFEFYTLSQTVTEGESATITVKRLNGTDGEVTINYETVAGTATASDYTEGSGTLTFADGVDTPQTITVQTTTDSEDESTPEVFTVVLSSPVGGASLNDAKDTHTITVEDPAQNGEISFSKQTYSVTEGQTLEITLTRTGGTDGDGNLMYQVTAGTAALADLNLEIDHGFVYFYDGEDSITISIPTVDDSSIEGSETFTITLSDISGAEEGTYTTATVTIADNDKTSTKDDDDDDDDSTTSTTDSSTSDTTTPKVSEIVKALQDDKKTEEVSNLGQALKDLITDKFETLETEETEIIFESMEDSVEFITNEEQLETALTGYIETIDLLSDMTQETSNVVWVNNKVIEMNEVVAEAIQKIEDDAVIVELTKTFVESIEEVQADSLIVKTVQMKEAVETLAQGALNKLSELEVETITEKVGEATAVQFEQEGLDQLIQDKVESFKELTETFSEFYGDENVRDFELQVTLATERVDDQVQVQLDTAVLDTLDEAGVDAVGVQVGGLKLMLDREIYTSEEVITKPKVVVDMDFDDKIFTEKDEKVNFKKGYVTDINVVLDGEKKEVLEKPVRLSFELDDFEFWEADASVAQLSVFRLNEETDEWEPVGGVYDPVTNSLSTRRISLSQYTVMQSNKAFSDVENSWAKDEINELLNKGILDEDVAFNPEETITREEFTTWVARAYGVTNDNATAPFTDIDPEHEHYTEIASAYSSGLVSGSGGGSFNPEATITKEQMSAILANAMVEYDQKQMNEGLTGTLASATDADLVSDWAGDDMAMLMELGVIGKEAGNLNPQQEMTKEEAAAILKKIYG